MSEITLDQPLASVSTRRSTYALMQALEDHPDDLEQAFSDAISAARVLREARGSIREEYAEAEFESAVLVLAEYGIRVAA